jgi:hypothetical protein
MSTFSSAVIDASVAYYDQLRAALASPSIKDWAALLRVAEGSSFTCGLCVEQQWERQMAAAGNACAKCPAFNACMRPASTYHKLVAAVDLRDQALATSLAQQLRTELAALKVVR